MNNGMDNEEARAILSAYRAGESIDDDARFEQAFARTETDPALAQWWEEEQELDRVIGSKLDQIEVPGGLKARILQPQLRSLASRVTWPRKLATLAAAIVLLAVFFGSWQGLFQPATSLADYRDEMVSFVRLAPSLDLETRELSRVCEFLEEKGAPSKLNLPAGLEAMKPVGCRMLRFRGENVSLVCFLRGQGDLVHLLVVDRKAMAKAKHAQSAPEFVGQGDWMTAMWADDGHTYLLAAKGDRKSLEKYFGTS